MKGKFIWNFSKNFAKKPEAFTDIIDSKAPAKTLQVKVVQAVRDEQLENGIVPVQAITRLPFPLYNLLFLLVSGKIPHFHLAFIHKST